jgi:aryl sulfotransferase
MYNHHVSANDLWYMALNNTPGLVGPPIEKPNPDQRAYFLEWLEEDGHPFWPFWENLSTWWEARDLPNVKLIHFNNLKADLDGEMRSLAEFLEVDIPAEKWPTVVEHCTFDWMKANAEKMAPLGGLIFEGGAGQFINKGSNGRWKDVLTPADSLAYEQMARDKLGEDCARWLMTGEL